MCSPRTNFSASSVWFLLHCTYWPCTPHYGRQPKHLRVCCPTPRRSRQHACGQTRTEEAKVWSMAEERKKTADNTHSRPQARSYFFPPERFRRTQTCDDTHPTLPAQKARMTAEAPHMRARCGPQALGEFDNCAVEGKVELEQNQQTHKSRKSESCTRFAHCTCVVELIDVGGDGPCR